MRYQYRVTKYDPAFRTEGRRYLKDDWISISDIGRSYNGVVLTEEEYLRVESAYLYAVESFLREAGIDALFLKKLECHDDLAARAAFAEAAWLGISECVEFARLALREKVWGKLVLPRRAYVHFGYDYYMFIGVPRFCPRAISEVTARGLFVEPFRSPYLRQPPRIRTHH